MCSLKISFCTNEKKQDFWEKNTETAFRNEGPNEPTVNAEVEQKKSKRSRISKSFGPIL